MDAKKIVEEIVVKNNGIAKSSDFVLGGISAQEVVKLCNNGYLERIRHGYYQLAEHSELSEEQMIVKLISNGVICLESALFHYGYSDFAPRKWSIAVPRTISRKQLEIVMLPIQKVYVQKNIYDLGKTASDFNKVVLPIYDRERTICDCFKYRTRFDSEIFNKALHAYAKDNNKNLVNLSIYAKKLHVYKKVTELMEVLLNG